MPLIEVRAFERRFEDEAKTQQLIAALTNAMVDVFGEEVRPETWVIVDGVSPKNWGFGGEVRS
jgi:4-oxalocrotonate tautomerase